MRVTVQHSGTEIPTCEGNKFAQEVLVLQWGQVRVTWPGWMPEDGEGGMSMRVTWPGWMPGDGEGGVSMRVTWPGWMPGDGKGGASMRVTWPGRMPGDGEGGRVHGYLGHLLRCVHVTDVDLHVLAGARQQHAVMAEGDRSHLRTHTLTLLTGIVAGSINTGKRKNTPPPLNRWEIWQNHTTDTTSDDTRFKYASPI